MKDELTAEVFELENDFLRIKIVPALGGKISSVYNKKLEKEFLWHNDLLSLKRQEAGADYDLNFWGGIDELLPNDIPETVDNIAYPDHGELWTSVLYPSFSKDKITLSKLLKLSGLYYEKEITLNANSPRVHIRYRIHNRSGQSRRFLWKMHAALRISEGDFLMSTARKARVVYPNSSRFLSAHAFDWPLIVGENAAIIPAKNGTMDFFYLYDTVKGEMGMLSEGGQHLFAYEYDKNIFPYEWYFASYGQFHDHYVAILEPASAMPVSVEEAYKLKQCSVLDPEEEINTIINIYAGPNL